MTILDKLGKELLFFDGAMGTILQNNGLLPGDLPELWNITKEELILDVHKSYLNAGCNLLKTNTFGANPFKMKETKYSCEEIVTKAVQIAKRAVLECNVDAFVGLDIGSLGKLLKPLGDLSFDDAYDAFKTICTAGEKAGADFVLIETMSDTYEVKAAVLAAKETTTLPVFVTMIFDEGGKLLTGADIAAVTALLEGLRVDAIGINCGLGPFQMKELLPQLVEITSLPIIVNPNAGLPTVIDGKTQFNVNPAEFAQIMKEIIITGASVVGGCCGTTPDHIKEMILLCQHLAPVPIQYKTHSLISSYSHVVELNEVPKIIGERINPTGKSRFKQALRDKDLEYIYKEALAQQDCGAHILDVNVGLPEINETEMMELVITGIQSILDLPLQIDTTNLEAMERAMRIYNGKPLINSVNGKKESMETVFPLVQKYGGMVVCLALDEDGIPETAEGRISVAKKIIDTAKSYGIDKKDLIIDPLAMTISTGAQNARITLEALRYIRKELKIHTTLGVSNISFGLPQRELINNAFYTMALDNGLSAGIINPLSESMMHAYYSFCALHGTDNLCSDYIRYVTDTPSEKATPTKKEETVSLFDSVIKGLAESAYLAAQSLLAVKEPLVIIDEDLIPALDKVGKGFEDKTIFLPQLLMSAEAAKSAFQAIKETLSKNGGTSSTSKGTVVIATVKGDIHDIGKNIVKVLLENYSFNVIDLGKDVDPADIVAVVLENDVKLVGLSALMTTTVANMEITIKELRKVKPDCKIMVGGAVLTQTYADMIDADFYSKDAMGSIRYANALFA